MDIDYLKATHRYVRYGQRRWEILDQKRRKAMEVMECLSRHGFDPILYGSVARGDVDEESDIDVFLPTVPNPDLVESIVERELGGFVKRSLVQATPSHAVKGYIYIDELTMVSFPLVDMKQSELDFYNVAGHVKLDDLKRGIRVPGMNKELVVIIPVEDGHVEFPAEQDPDVAASLIGARPSAVRERIAVLRKRRELGRAGVYREVYLYNNDNFGSALKELLRLNPLLKRRV